MGEVDQGVVSFKVIQEWRRDASDGIPSESNQIRKIRNIRNIRKQRHF